MSELNETQSATATAEPAQSEPGTFCWVDVQTADQSAGKDFYCNLFGWSAEDMPAGESTVYSMCRLDGKDVAAVAPLPSEPQGIPPHWNSYISTTDVDATTEKAKSLGGTALMEPFDVMEAGRMAVIQDPTGAVICFWQPRQHQSAGIYNVPGSLVWNELMTRDVEKAKEFYTSLLGWTSETQPFGEMEYTTFKQGERPCGGLMAMHGMPEQVPPNWLVYFATDDTDATVEKAKSLGAQIAVEPQDIPEVGRFAVISDPQGATFGVIKLINPPS